jgi:hypothetical protein
MKFVIEPVTDTLAAARAAYIREEVFGREWNLRVPPVAARNGCEMLTLIARPESQSEPAAVLTVIETTGNQDLHRSLGLMFHERTRIARYMQLAVLKQYRGLNLPVHLVLEARSQFVAPKRIDYTWMLFDAERAQSSSFCRLLGFRASSETFYTEYGCSRVLLRNDALAMAELNGWSTQEPLTGHRTNGHVREPGAHLHTVRRILADEWVAQ